MSGRFRCLYAVCAASALAFIGFVGQAHSAEKVKWALIGDLSFRPHFKLVEKPFWTEILPRLSDGQIEPQLRGWDELGLKGPEVWHFIQQGTYAGGSTSMARNAGELPLNAGIDLAGLAPTPEDLNRILDAVYPGFARWNEERYNLKVLSFFPFPPQIALCRSELKSLVDLKGRKVRVTSTSQAVLMESLGATTVNVAFPEVQTALQTGVVDCALSSALAAYGQGWYESAKFIYPLAINWQIQMLLVNGDKWKQLDPKVRDRVTNEMPNFRQRSWAQNLQEINLGLACMTGDKQYGECTQGKPGNMKVIAVQAGDRELFNKALREKVVPRWAKQCGAECVKLWNETIGKVVGVEAPLS
ncbi:MAG: TRAP transporter substrate-binding protein [Proteobacteria bacterium]|nr:TRAP transporter substrate-binding protein [Pseudomonadota bacterium]